MNKQQRKQITALLAEYDWLPNFTAEPSTETTAFQACEALKEACEAIMEEEQEKFDAMPDSLQSGSKGETMQEGIDSLQGAIDSLDEAIEKFEEVESLLSDAFDSLGAI